MFFALLLVGYAAIMLVKLDLWRHNVLISDWVFMKNILWNTSFSDGLVLFSEARLRQYGYPSYLNEHFSPLLIPLALLYKALPSGDFLLLFLHGACPALVSLSLRGIGLQLFGDRRLAALMALGFAFNPAILQPTIDSVYGFHSDSLSPPLLALAAWAFIDERWKTYWVAVVSALLVKENIPAYGVIFGALLVYSPRYRRLGIATALMSAAVFLFGSRGLPLITGLTNRNVGYAETFLADLLALRPTFDYTLQEAFYALRNGLAFLPALMLWPFLALTGPDFLVIGQVGHANLSSWHVMPALAIFGILAVIGSRCLTQRRPLWQGRLRAYWWTVAVVAIIAGGTDLFVKHGRFMAMGSVVDDAAVKAAQAAVPANAGIATTTDIEQFFAHRRVVFTTLGYPGIEYVAVNMGAISSVRSANLSPAAQSDRELTVKIEELAQRGEAELLSNRQGLRVFKLREPTSAVRN